MPQQAWRADDFDGLTPGIDPRRSEKFFALNGQNYVFDSLGVKSPFGNRYLTPYGLGLPAHAQGYRLNLRSGNRTFTMTGDAIMEWKEDVGGWRILYITPDTTLAPYRWTFGYLNGKVYFCHPSVGIIVYDLDSDSCYRHNGAGVPSSPIALCVNNGRLCVIDPLYFYWSTQSNGMDFTPKLAGAGYQLISDRVPGEPIMISDYAAGVLIWTTGGCMVSRFTADQAVYQHRLLNTEYSPINSFCVFQTDENTIVILDERGFFQSQGGAPTAFAPVFNEFLIDYIKRLKLTTGDVPNVRVEWDSVYRRVYLSVSQSRTDPLFESAFVYYPPLDKWGQFSESHYGVIPIRISTGERAGDYSAFVDGEGRVRILREIGSREVLPADPSLDSFYPLVQKPDFAIAVDSGMVLSSSAAVSTVPMGVRDGQPAGFFARSGDVPAPVALTGLSARIQLGLLRFPLQDTNDRLVEVIQLFVGSIVSASPDGVSTDFNLIPQGVTDDDYNVVAAAEQYGVEVVGYVNSNLRIIGTKDGRSEFYSEVPALVEYQEAGRYYSCCVPGVWHILEMSADDVGEAFHLQSFELTGAAAGRLS